MTKRDLLKILKINEDELLRQMLVLFSADASVRCGSNGHTLGVSYYYYNSGLKYIFGTAGGFIILSNSSICDLNSDIVFESIKDAILFCDNECDASGKHRDSVLTFYEAFALIEKLRYIRDQFASNQEAVLALQDKDLYIKNIALFKIRS